LIEQTQYSVETIPIISQRRRQQQQLLPSPVEAFRAESVFVAVPLQLASERA
jgi:hypothetical protein